MRLVEDVIAPLPLVQVVEIWPSLVFTAPASHYSQPPAASKQPALLEDEQAKPSRSPTPTATEVTAEL